MAASKECSALFVNGVAAQSEVKFEHETENRSLKHKYQLSVSGKKYLSNDHEKNPLQKETYLPRRDSQPNERTLNSLVLFPPPRDSFTGSLRRSSSVHFPLHNAGPVPAILKDDYVGFIKASLPDEITGLEPPIR